MTNKKVGRPSLLNQELLQKAKEYIDRFSSSVVDKEEDAMRLEVIPSVAGLALHLGISRTTIYDWVKEEGECEYKAEFSDTLERLKALQEAALINGGLQGRFNANIAKLALANHGYSDKQEVDTKSSDGSMTPKSSITNDQIKEIVRDLKEEI